MIGIDLKINGVLIGHLYMHNRSGTVICDYYGEFHDIGKGADVIKFDVKHKRSDGALTLVRKAIQKIEKLEKK